MENCSNLIKCFICSENIKEARILPCFHSFCFDCLVTRFFDDVYLNRDKYINCPQCELPFEVPEGGIEELKKNEFIDNIINSSENTASLSSQTTCEVCSEKTASKYCVDCKQNICVSCVIIHEKFQSLKNHVLVDILVNGIDTKAVKYCKSCNILLTEDGSMSHNSCTVVDLSEFKSKIHKSLEQNYQDLSSIKKYLNHFDETNQSTTEDAETLKKQIQFHGENLKSYMETYIDGCVRSCIECIDEECSRIKKKLSLSRKPLLELETKLQEQIEKNKNNLQNLNQEIVIKTINDNLMGKMEQSSISTDEMKEQILLTFPERSTLYFEPTVLNKFFYAENNIVGLLREGSKSKLKPIKVINVIVSLRSWSMYGMKLYGFDCFSEIKGKTFFRLHPIKISVFCSKTYESLYSTDSKIDCHHEGILPKFTLVNRFLCLAISQKCLIIFDFNEKKDTPGWKKEVNLSFEIDSLFPSSNENIFVLSSQKIFEITLNGDILKKIHLPSDPQLNGSSYIPTGFVNLENDCYGAIISGQLYVMDIHGNITRKFLTESLHRQKKINNFAQMVTDKSSNIFVTSSYGREIFIFDYNLNYVKLLEAECIATCLCYDSRRNHLLVFGDNKLNVFQL